LVPRRPMTLNGIWRSFQPMLSFPRPISEYTIRPQKLNLLIRNHTTAFRWYNCQPWQYFKVITVSHQTSRKRCVIQQVTTESTNRKSYTSFRLVPILMTLKNIWKSFQSRLSFPRPLYTNTSTEFQQSLTGIHVARSLINSWVSCFVNSFTKGSLIVVCNLAKL